ncbi:cytochrome P450 [Ketobacter sp.]
MGTLADEATNLPKKPSRQVDHIPGESGLPVIGFTLHFLSDFHGLVNRMVAKHGPVFRYRAVMQDVITLTGPDANEFILRDAERNFSSKKAWDIILEKLFPNGLMLRDFENHKVHRKILQGAFKKPVLEAYVEKMNISFNRGLSSWPVQKEMLFFNHIKTLLLNTGAELFIGIKLGAEADKVNQSFIAAVDASLAILRMPIPGTTWWKGMRGRRYLEHFLGSLVAQKRLTEDNDFFSQICHSKGENGEQLSDEEVRDHMIFLLFAAHDTTTSTITSLIYRLAKHPQWQHILREEMLTFGKDTLTYEDLDDMEKTSLVFRETLRMHPALPTIPRRAVNACEFKGFKIPKNAAVGVVPLHTHYMEEYWTNPYKFDPERFSAARAEHKKHFYQWVPFGGGQHKCLGLNFAEIQTKMFLFHFLRKYRIEVRHGYEMPVQVVPLAVPKDGFPCTLHSVNR